MENKRKVSLSGIQPSGKITLGNYLGSIKNWVDIQDSDEYDNRYCVVDLHAITVRQDPDDLREQTYQLFAQLMAAGLDPDKCILFIQSHVQGHPELSWILSCFTMFGELSRMTQFKDKSQRHADNINAGLFTYPVLMAADILIYDADIIPVGEDQRQHVELARDIAIRFNNRFPGSFVVPEAYIPKEGAKIMSLQDPSRKMSKSDTNENSFILVMDPPEAIVKKMKRAVTDSDARVAASPDKPGVTNLMHIYAAATGKSFAEIEAEFEGKGYGVFKPAVADAVVELLRPLREKSLELLKDKAYLEDVMAKGAEKARAITDAKVRQIYDKLGFIARR
ncbi:MAG: tryptophan--tRNA ligase [Clostridia bacterium]|nr:tryptophan--tRNA ligase [Clostridia bacterium]